MGVKTLKIRAAVLRAKRTAVVNGGGSAVFEWWDNKTQDINLFVNRGNRHYPFVGFNITNKFENTKPNKVSFVPSYNQILLFLAELNNWQPDGYDKDFWLEVASKALGALSEGEKKYTFMYKLIEEELGGEIEGGVQRLGAPRLYAKERHFCCIHSRYYAHLFGIKNKGCHGGNRYQSTQTMDRNDAKEVRMFIRKAEKAKNATKKQHKTLVGNVRRRVGRRKKKS